MDTYFLSKIQMHFYRTKCRLLIFTLVLVLLYGCRTNAGEKEAKFKVEMNNTKFHLDREAFAPFYQKFCMDSSFQYSRIKFPIPIKEFKYTTADTLYPPWLSPHDTILWDEKNWELLRTFGEFMKRMKAKREPRDEDAFWKERIDSTNDTYVITIRGIYGTSRFNKAEFKLYDKKYYLVHYWEANL